MITMVRAIIKFLVIQVIVFTGKLLAYVWTPIVFPLRFYGMNAVHNYCINNGGDHWIIDRLNQVRHLYRDDGDRWRIYPRTYHSNGGYLTKRKVSKLEALFALVFIYFWVDPDANLDVTSEFIAIRDFIRKERSDTGMILDGEPVDFGAKLITYGGYFLCGDRMRENDVSYWKTFKAMYQWTVIRNGFYGFNYTILESWLENFSANHRDWTVKKIFGTDRGDFNEKGVRLKTDIVDGVRRVTVDQCVFGFELSTSSIDGSNFFLLSGAWIVQVSGLSQYEGRGFEFGWRRFGSATARVRKLKASKLDYDIYRMARR